jgi:hypothetical protein
MTLPMLLVCLVSSPFRSHIFDLLLWQPAGLGYGHHDTDLAHAYTHPADGNRHDRRLCAPR